MRTVRVARPFWDRGKDNPAVNAEGGAAVNLRRFMKAVRYAQHVLAQKEYAEGAECLQYNEGKVGIVHAERLNHDELGDHDGMPGNHHGCQVSHKYFISSRKLQLGKCKGRKGAGEQLEQGDDNRQLQGVQKNTAGRVCSAILFHNSVSGTLPESTLRDRRKSPNSA